MSDEATVAWKDYVDERFKDFREAVRVANEAMDKRLESMNEFRSTLKDQTKEFPTRNEVSNQYGKLEVDLNNAKNKLNETISRHELMIMLDKINIDIRNLTSAKDILEGKASQTSVIISIVLAIIGLATAVLSWLR